MSLDDERLPHKNAETLDEDRKAVREWNRKHKHDLLIDMVEPWPVKVVRRLFEKEDPHIRRVDPFKR